MLPSGFSRSSDRPGYGWIFALVGVVFLAFGIGRVEAAGPYSAAHGLKSPSVPSAAPSGPRVNHRAINRSNIGSRAGGSSRFSIDKSRLSNRKTIKTKRKAVKKPTGKKKITAKHSPAISNKVKDQAKKKATADVGHETPQLTELAKEHLPVPRPPQAGERGTDAFDPDAANARKGQSALIGALTDASSGNATNNSTPYNEFAEAPALATESVITHVPGLTLAAQDVLTRIKENAGWIETGTGESHADQFGLGGESLSVLPDKGADNPLSPEGTHSENDDDVADTMGPAWDLIGASRYKEGSSLGILARLGAGAARQDNTGGKHGRILDAVGSRSDAVTGPLNDNRVMQGGGGNTQKNVEPKDVTEVGQEVTTSSETAQVVSETFFYSNGNADTIYYDSEGNITAMKSEFAGGETVWINFNEGSPSPECIENPSGCEGSNGFAVDFGLPIGSVEDSRRRALVAAITREWTGQPGHDDQHNDAGSSGQGTPWERARLSGGGSGNSLGAGYDEHCKVAYCGEDNIGVGRDNGRGPGRSVFRMLRWIPQYAPM